MKVPTLRDLTCPECRNGYKYSTKYVLLKHIKDHHSKKKECPKEAVQRKKFQYWGLMVRHTTESEKPSVEVVDASDLIKRMYDQRRQIEKLSSTVRSLSKELMLLQSKGGFSSLQTNRLLFVLENVFFQKGWIEQTNRETRKVRDADAIASDLQPPNQNPNLFRPIGVLRIEPCIHCYCTISIFSV